MRDLNSVEQRLQRIEDKLDTHLGQIHSTSERIVKLEEGLSGVRGYIKVILSTVTAIISLAVTGIIQYLTKHP